jgi:lipopolysaccharide transport system ATP-binding protein
VSEPAIRAEKLGKRYRIGQREPYATLRDVIGEALRGGLRRSRDRGANWIWSLKEVSFEVQRGEVLGIVGRNGAGKTTLLKVLSRITEPNEGEAEIEGRVGSLLEVGTGFHPELTGRENIYLNGAILGMKKAEIDRKFDQIVSFAETEQFIDTPVKRYSSGMSVRLAFAVSAHLEPEILLLDEVLAVGDAGFQAKCLERIRSLREQGGTILLVSHNMASIVSLCSRVLWLEAGRILLEGSPDSVVHRYLGSTRSNALARSLADQKQRHGEGAARMTAVSLYERENPASGVIGSGADVNVEIAYRAETGKRIDSLVAAITIENELRQRIAFCQNTLVGRDFSAVAGEGAMVCSIRRLPLVPGQYSLSLALWVNGVPADGIYQALDFQVSPGRFYPTGLVPLASYGNVLLDYDWAWQAAEEVPVAANQERVATD